MNKWLKWFLWGTGGLAAAWVLASALRPPAESEKNGAVPYVYPSGTGKLEPAGLSSFHDGIPAPGSSPQPSPPGSPIASTTAVSIPQGRPQTYLQLTTTPPQ